MSDPRHIPTEEVLKQAGALNVLDSQGKEVQFASIYAAQKTIIVFIRERRKVYLLAFKQTQLSRSFFLRRKLVLHLSRIIC